MRRSTAAALALCFSAVLCSCAGGRSSGFPAGAPLTAPGTTHASWTFSGRVTETVTGVPVANATVSAGGMSATTTADGRFQLSRQTAPALPLEATITSDGHLTRTTHLSTSGTDIDVIATAAGFDLEFYRQIARNGYDKPGALDVIRVWSTAPRYYVRTTYADAPDESVDRGIIAMARSELPAATRTLSNGRFPDAQVDSGSSERQRVDGVVNVSFYKGDLPTGANYCGFAYVGPPSSEAAFTIEKTGCACGGSHKVATATVWHEVGHVLGLRHTPQGNNNLMAPMLEDRCTATPQLSPLEAVHVPIANHRPQGNMDVDRDPVAFCFLRPDTAVQPLDACLRTTGK